MSDSKKIFPVYIKDAQEAASLASATVIEAKNIKNFALYKCDEAANVVYANNFNLSDLDAYYKALREFKIAEKAYIEAYSKEEKTQSKLAFLYARYKCVCAASLVSEDNNISNIKAYYEALNEYDLIAFSYCK